jgi:predicted nucleic acid-binding protein
MTDLILPIFLDTNILFSASRSSASPFHQFWRLQHLELLTSAHSLGEVRRNYRSIDQQQRGEDLIRSMRVVSDRPDMRLPAEVSLPDKDAPIYLAALAAGAKYLITGDKNHFSPYFNRSIMGMTFMLPTPFLELQGR